MRRATVLLMIFLGLLSCLDPITIDVTSENDPKLVVDGQLNNSGKKQILKLSTTLPFGQKFFAPVTGASASICELPSGDCFPYSKEEPGVYAILPQSFMPQEGNEYFVEINFPDGNIFSSSPQRMPISQKADSAYHKFDREVVLQKTGIEFIREVLKIFANTPIDNSDGEVYLRWAYDELFLFHEVYCGPFDPTVTCYVPLRGNAQIITLVRSNLLENNRIDDLEVGRKTSFPLEEFMGRHYFNIYQYSISKEAFNYWSSVKNIVSQSGTVFDLPPVSIPGNVIDRNDPDNIALGFFEVTTVDVVRTFVQPSEFKENISQFVVCSQFESRSLWPPECCNCQNFPNSSLDRPEWVK